MQDQVRTSWYGLNSLCSCGARSVTWDFHGMTGYRDCSGIQWLVVPDPSKKTVALRLKTNVTSVIVCQHGGQDVESVVTKMLSGHFTRLVKPSELCQPSL